jgi:hypothetical protein
MLLVSRGDMLANPAGCLRYLSDWVSEAGQASRLDAGRKIDLGTDRTFRANVAGDQAGPVA